MSLKITIKSGKEMRDIFKDCDRDYYSLDAYQALYEYYHELDDIELDVVAICCDWDELSIDDAISEYSIDLSNITDDDGEITDVDKEKLVLDYLTDRTYAVITSKGILFQNF
jgi:chaperonin GroEL (HSP60 family)